ncbi:galactose-binding domain-like protein [Suillus clintonianus]|uniref:galactose-binding domain-like protein n=1 Tax=Suillus clintonianus TaxID=1904413 RepID=UPI001B860B50|nr:galactose-binding domain-like protein [Suillus clintonianus]KAG2153967.1 galactose-binding domain-like protein [Suillus clintonianus]
MPHNHHDGHCSHESHEHDHDHDTSDLGPNDNLFSYIDRANVVALNATREGSVVIKPWDQRSNEEVCLESDADDQLILRIPFTGSVRLRSLLLKTGPGDQTPTKVALFSNQPSMDFNDVSDKAPVQEFDIPQDRNVAEYAVKTAKFNNVSSLTLFFPASQGADTTRIYYVGLLGHWTERKSDPVITVYETQANLADHEKIQGTDGNFSTTQS